MKKIIIILIILALVGGVYIYSTKKSVAPTTDTTLPAPTDTATASSPEATAPTAKGDTVISGSYTIDTTNSKTTWSSKKTLKENWIDTGTIALTSGNFEIKDGIFSSGKLTFDTTSIKVTTTGMGEKGLPMLEKHLKSKDFFKVDQYPTAVFTLKKGDSSSITGDLKLLDTTKEISVPVTVSKVDGKVHIVGQTKVNRTDFGIKYGSSSFFDNLKDNVIDDYFTLDFDIVTQ